MKSRSLQIQQPESSAVVVEIKQPAFRLGRADDNDLVLSDRNVSRWHASITNLEDGPALLTDLNSANGTYLNGQRVQSPCHLKPDDQLTIGHFVMVFREEQHNEDDSFTIEAGRVSLEEIQHDPQVLVTSRSARLDSPGDLRSLELLFEAGITLARSQTIEDVCTIAVDLLFKIEQVNRATVMLWDEENNTFEAGEIHFRGGSSVAPEQAPYDPRALVLSKTIINRVRQENRPLLIRDTKSEEILTSALSIVRAGIQAAFCAPLTCQNRFLGILYADNLIEPNAFSETDFRIFTAVAAQAGLALGNALANRELIRREVQRQALKAYLPPQVADLILASDGNLDLSGKLQQVTVLFADIRGFTRMSEQMDAREVVTLLNDFFNSMSREIFHCGGTVDKFIGDCIMALFGAPIAAADAADRALAAAKAMQKAARKLNSERISNNQCEIHIGVGLHTGTAVVGNIGSNDRVQYTAIGDTVNVASRLVSRASPDQIMVSEDFRQALSHMEDLTFVGESELKGRQSKLGIYVANWQAASVPGGTVLAR